MKKTERTFHANSVPDDRAMTAPYNFVPLPERVFIPEGEVPKALEFPVDAERCSGVIEYECESLSPVYTRAAVPITSKSTREAERDFFHHGDSNKPCLPGASVRGMIRSLVTLLSCGKLPRTKTARRLFFRSFARDVLAREYVQRMTENNPGVQGPKGRLQGFKSKTLAGFLKQTASGAWVIEPCHQLRASHKLIPPDVHERKGGQGSNTMYVLSKKQLYRPVWFKAAMLEPEWRHHRAQSGPGMYTWRRDVEALSLDKPDQATGWHEGWLVVTGPIQRKAAEFVFARRPNAPTLPVKDETIREINDPYDQLTQFQEASFDPDGRLETKPARGKPFREPYLRPDGPPGIPVWYLEEGGSVTALGRAQNFRLRYEKSTDQFIPEGMGVDVEELDLAERIFGRVREKPRAKKAEDGNRKERETDQIRSRVRFEDAECLDSQPYLPPLGGASKGDRVPLILSSPKPTAFQNYLCQPQTGELELRHYSKETEIRGYKLYWHRNQAAKEPRERTADGTESRERLPEERMFQARPDARGTQETVIRPVKAGKKFQGRIRFDNLTHLELGALLAALELCPGLAHRFGMGKPLGLGSLKMRNVSVKLINRRERYSSWEKDGTVEEKEANGIVENCRSAFRQAMVAHNNLPGTSLPRVPEDTELWRLPRNQVLAMMLSWSQAPAASQTAYVGLEDRTQQLLWRRRNVLPGPHQVIRASNPLSTGRQVQPQPPATTKPAQGSSRPAPAPVFRLELGHEYEAELVRAGKKGEWAARVQSASLTVRQVHGKPDEIKAGAKVIVVIKGFSDGEFVGFFQGLAPAIVPDKLPDDATHEAEVLGRWNGGWRARLVGGTREWMLKGQPPQGKSVEPGSKVRVRIVRGENEHLVFDSRA